ncbi:MAG: nucleoside hydrolase, partial [Acidimicrobiales bacterium]
MAEPLPIVIDTDGGVDDAAALWWALTSPLVEVVAVTTVWGNVGIDLATDNVCRVLHAAGRDDSPVAVGAGGPVGEAPDLRVPDFIHGADGLGDTN